VSQTIVQLLLQTADDDDVELDLSSDDASRFALDMLEAAAAVNPDNELAASADGQGDEAISGVKVEVADYGIGQSLQNIFLTLREKGWRRILLFGGQRGMH
jgi:hypothetical protein